MPRATYADAVITGTKTPGIPLCGNVPCGFITPATLTSTAISFEMANKEDGTYVPVKSSGGSALSFTVTTSSYYGFTKDQIAHFYGAEFIKLVGGSSEAAARPLKLALRDIA